MLGFSEDRDQLHTYENEKINFYSSFTLSQHVFFKNLVCLCVN